MVLFFIFHQLSANLKNYAFGNSADSFGLRAEALLHSSGRFLIIFTHLLHPGIFFAGRFEAARRPGERPGEAARNSALDVFLKKVKDGEPPGSRQKVGL